MAAMEAIKVLTGFEQPLKNVLWFFDLETNIVRRLRTDCRLPRLTLSQRNLAALN